MLSVSLTLLEQLPGAVLVTDAKGLVVYTNTPAETLLGWDQPVPQPRRLWTAFEAGGAKAVEVLMVEHKPVAGFVVDCRLRHPAEPAVWAEVHGIPLELPGGVLSGFLVLLRPVAAPVVSEESAAKDRTAANMAEIRRATHDLNNIFTSIYSSLELVATQESLAGKARDFVSGAQHSARRGAELVTRLRSLILSPGDTSLLVGSGTKETAAPGFAAPATLPTRSLDGTERILLVDDDQSVRTLIRAVLSYRGYRIEEAGSGEMAVSLYGQATQPFDLVLMDHDLPGMKGPQAASVLRRHGVAGPVLFLSGAAEEAPAEGAPSSHGDHFLSKPFSNVELVATVRRILDQTRPAGQQGTQAADAQE